MLEDFFELIIGVLKLVWQWKYVIGIVLAVILLIKFLDSMVSSWRNIFKGGK